MPRLEAPAPQMARWLQSELAMGRMMIAEEIAIAIQVPIRKEKAIAKVLLQGRIGASKQTPTPTHHRNNCIHRPQVPFHS